MSLFGKKRNYDTHFAPKVDEKNAEDLSKTFNESFMDEWHYQTYTGNSYSKTNNLHDEYEKEIEEIKRQTGKELKNPYHSAFEDFLVEDVAFGLWDELIKNPFSTDYDYYDRREQERLQKRINKYQKDLEKLRKDFPDLKFRDEETIQEDIKKQALKYYNKVNDNREDNGVGSFLGSAAGSIIDPINFFTSLVSGGTGAAKESIGKALGKTAFKEFINNAAVESLIQPKVYDYKKELDIPYSKSEAAMNVVAAGFGGAALGTAGKAVHLTGKEILSRYKKAIEKGVEFDAKVKADAAFLEQKTKLDDWLDETNPYGNDLEDRVLHEKSIEMEMRRLTNETDKLSEAYDRVLENPIGDPNDPLIAIEPKDMETVWIERGSKKPYNGNSKFGYGLVKFIFHHGEKSAETNKLSKADVVAFPSIIREYLPVPEESYDKSRLWRVVNEKGQKVVYIDRRFSEDGSRHIVTMFVEDRAGNENKPLSPKKNAAGKLSAHTKDTTLKPYYQHKESSANASAPKSHFPDGGDVYNNINADEINVNDYSLIDADSFKKELDKIPDLTPEEKKLNNETIEKFKQEDGWDEQIIECITEFSKK